MGFVKFTKPRARLGSPRASIWSRGQIGFNQGAVEEYNLTKHKYVVMYYDDDHKKVGFQFTNDKNAEGAIKLLFRNNSGVSLSAVAFLKTYKIDYGETKQYNLDYDDENKLHVIDLDKPTN